MICTEGKFRGFPTTFIELADGNNKKVKKKAVATIISEINKMKNSHVMIIGDDVLEQEETLALVYELEEKSIKVCICANNSRPIDDTRSSRNFFYQVEVHCPSSEMEGTNYYENLRNLSSKDEVMFFIERIEDYVFAKATIKKYPTLATIIFTPTLGIHPDLVQWIIEDKPNRVRLGDI